MSWLRGQEKSRDVEDNGAGISSYCPKSPSHVQRQCGAQLASGCPRYRWIQSWWRCSVISPAIMGVESGTWKARRKARQKAANWGGLLPGADAFLQGVDGGRIEGCTGRPGAGGRGASVGWARMGQSLGSSLGPAGVGRGGSPSSPIAIAIAIALQSPWLLPQPAPSLLPAPWERGDPL